MLRPNLCSRKGLSMTQQWNTIFQCVSCFHFFFFFSIACRSHWFKHNLARLAALVGIFFKWHIINESADFSLSRWDVWFRVWWNFFYPGMLEPNEFNLLIEDAYRKKNERSNLSLKVAVVLNDSLIFTPCVSPVFQSSLLTSFVQHIFKRIFQIYENGFCCVRSRSA